MGARNRTQPKAQLESYPQSFWKLAGAPSGDFKRRLLGYAGARAAFEKLKKKGVSKDLLWTRLWGVALVKLGETLRKESKRVSTRRSKLFSRGVQGFPEYTLRRLPDRLRRMAQEIKTLNERLRSDAIYQSVAELIVTHLPEFDPTELTILPAQLRLYATYLDSLNRLLSGLRARSAKLTAPSLPLVLTDTVCALTGKHYWNEVATLLTAAYQANACDMTVDPNALKMQHSRRSRRTR